jgi:hypothetical protein
MRHALWIAVVVVSAACGHSGDSPEQLTAGTKEQQSSVVLKRDTQGLRVVSTAKGQQLRLEGNFQSAAMVRRAADGSLQTECFDETAEADAFMAGTTKSRGAEAQ